MRKVNLVYADGSTYDITEEFHAADKTYGVYQLVQDYEYMTGATVQFGEVR